MSCALPKSLPVRVLVERFEAAIVAELLPVLTGAALLAAVLPEVYADHGQPGGPTTTLPGTPEREQVLRERVELRLETKHPLDAPPDGADRGASARGRDPRYMGVRSRAVKDAQPGGDRWEARVRIRGRLRLLGYYATAQDAAMAVRAAKRAAKLDDEAKDRD